MTKEEEPKVDKQKIADEIADAYRNGSLPKSGFGHAMKFISTSITNSRKVDCEIDDNTLKQNLLIVYRQFGDKMFKFAPSAREIIKDEINSD